VGPTTSWWQAEPVPVPLSLRERGDRAARGRTSRVPDPTADRLRLTAEAEREAEQRQAAAAELALAGTLHGTTISPAARDLLLDLVAALLAQQGEEIVDHDAGLRLRAVDGPDTVVNSPDGTTTFIRLRLSVAAADDAGDTGWAETPWEAAQ
jgi:Protein of unknown function (DUF2397)